MKNYIRGKHGGKIYGVASRNEEGEYFFSFFQTEKNRDREVKHLTSMGMEVIAFEVDVDVLIRRKPL